MSSNLLGKTDQGLLFIVSAPAGAGKTTLVKKLCEEFPHDVVLNISYTTRPKRGDERDGVDYFFITEQEFSARIAQNDFFEHVTLFGHRYGSSKSFIQTQLSQGKHLFLVIDIEGTLQVQKSITATIFILPPSYDELQNRLRARATESETWIEKRLARAKHELEIAQHYDYHIVNDDLNTAYHVLKSIVIAETHRVQNKKGGYKF